MSSSQQMRSSVVNVVVAEANQMNCQLVENVFRPRRRRVSVLASAVASAPALELLKERKPDVAIVSAQLQDGPHEGYHVVRELRALHSKTRAIMLLDSRDRELVIDAF